MPHRLFSRLALLTLLLPALAQAYPPQVRELLKNAGQSFVVRAPGTIDDATKKDLEATAAATAQKTGGKVYFVIDNKTKPSDYDSLYTDLGLTGHDVVVASNGPGWSLQCGSLSAQQKQDILNREGLAGGQPLDRMKAIASDTANALASARPMTARPMTQATTGQPAPLPNAPSSGHGGLIFLGIVVAAIVGIVLWRRKKRDAALAEAWAPALEGPTQILTAVYMNLDGLEAHPNFSALMDQAGAVQKKLDDLKGQAPTRESIARAQALSAEANRVRLSFDQARRSLH